MGDEIDAKDSRQFLLLTTAILTGQFALGVVLPIDVTLGIDRFTGISFAGFPRELLAFLVLIAILFAPLLARRWILPRTTARERKLVFATAVVGGFVTFYVWKATIAVLVRTAPTLIPLVHFGIIVGLVYLAQRFRKAKQVSRKREEWFARSRITHRDLRYPRRIITDRYKLGYFMSFTFYLTVFVCSGAVFLTVVTDGTLSSAMLTIGSGAICFLFGQNLYGLARQ